MAQTLQHGKQNEIDDVLMLRDATAPEKYQAGFDARNPSRLERNIPILRLSRFLLQKLPAVRRPAVLWQLLRLNWQMTRDYVGYRTYMQAKARSDSSKRRFSPRTMVDKIAMKLTDPNPGPSFEDQVAAFRTWLRRFRQPGTLLPEVIRTREEGWAPLPCREVQRVDLSIILIVKDRLQDTLRLFNTIDEAAAPLSYEVIVIDRGSLDCTPQLFSGRKDMVFRCLDVSATLQDVMLAALRHSTSQTLAFVAPGTRLHHGSLQRLCSALPDVAMATASCGCAQCHSQTGRPNEWHGSFALGKAALQSCLATQMDAHLPDLAVEGALAERIEATGGRVGKVKEALVSR